MNRIEINNITYIYKMVTKVYSFLSAIVIEYIWRDNLTIDTTANGMNDEFKEREVKPKPHSMYTQFTKSYVVRALLCSALLWFAFFSV